jgi:uncharacterized SAM-binding protein YcdF (DUF218 family)
MLPELKPYLTALALPPASLLVIILIGALLVTSKPRLARRLVLLAATSLWLLSTSACSVWLHSQFVPNYPLITAKDLRSNSAQAVVVLGGGVVTGLPVDSTDFTPPSSYLGFKPYQSGNTCRAEVHSISRTTYFFLIQALAQISNSGLFATTPENVKTNIVTPTEAKTKAIGWFNMASVASLTKVIP